MSNLGKNQTVWCVPTKVDKHSQVVHVKVHGTDEEVRMLLRDLFLGEHIEKCRFFGGAVGHHEPYDIVSVDRPFAAKVTETDVLGLSRTQRIQDLWHELEVKARAGGCVLAVIRGQNKTHYSLNIEGNFTHRTPKAPLEEYLRSLVWGNQQKRRKYTPTEGDTVVARVVRASGDTKTLSLDLVEPLRCLESGKLDHDILSLFGSRTTHSNPQPVGIGTYSVGSAAPFKTLQIDHSPKLDQQRNATRVLVIDDDPCLATHLPRLLEEMGYQSDSIPPPADADHLVGEISPDTVFLIDANMKPVDGIALVRQLQQRAAAQGGHAKCVLISALTWDAPLEVAGRITLGKAAEKIRGLCLFWRKSSDGLESGLQELDELILHYDERLAGKNYVSSTFTIPLATRSAVEEPAGNVHAETTDDLQRVLDDLKRKSGAKWAALFEMDRHAWRVEFLAGEDFLKRQCGWMGAQSYLPNSPIRNISYSPFRTLLDGQVGNDIRPFRNLLRFFRAGPLDDPVDQPAFQSVAAIRLNLGTSKRYSLFIFHPRANKFHRETVYPLLDSASDKLELILLKQILAEQSRRQQPFYLEGLARAGLRHDAGAQLTDMQMLADYLAPVELDRGNIAEVRKLVRQMGNVSKQAHGRIEESLNCFRAESIDKKMDLREVIDDAERIAAGVATHSQATRKEVAFAEHCPKEEPCVVSGDRNALQRVVENLLVNAVEHGLAFIRPRVNILVEVQRVTDEAFPFAILVHDNGPGIRGMDKPHVFDALFSTKPNGYGMGLAVVKGIAEETGLNVEIAGSAALVGTTFIVKVPKEMRPRFS
ncbi:MAG: response regulator [Planctomycetes bacterium]|nr:response regulator [Planctomycetota bacterium]